jgi:hypothetical protein
MARKSQVDIASIVIQKHVPMPEFRKEPTPWLAIIKQMEVGDSFIVPNEKVANGLYQYFRQLNMRCTCKEIEAGFYRVWRRE